MKNVTYKKDGVVYSFQFKTSNTKTGDLVQTYMFPADWLETSEKIGSLSDTKVCFDCTHSKTKNKSCYVRKAMPEAGLASKVRSLRAVGLNNIPEYSTEIEDQILKGVRKRGVRFGSFGEPILLGEELVSKISNAASFWTGYTHQWHTNSWASKFFQASVESDLVADAAHKAGFRTFFVGVPSNKEAYVNCPASKEAGRKTTCDNCKLCQGTQSKAKSVYILPH